jgi:hypothetical protein
MGAEDIEVRHIAAELRPGRGHHQVVMVHAGAPSVEHIVPPAGEDYAFDVTHRPVNVEVTVSPTGRSVYVHVNGTLIATATGREVRFHFKDSITVT